MSAPGLGVRRGWVHMGCGVMRLRVGSLGFDPVDFPKGHFTNHMGPSSPKDTRGQGSSPRQSLLQEPSQGGGLEQGGICLVHHARAQPCLIVSAH